MWILQLSLEMAKSQCCIIYCWLEWITKKERIIVLCFVEHFFKTSPNKTYPGDEWLCIFDDISQRGDIKTIACVCNLTLSTVCNGKQHFTEKQSLIEKSSRSFIKTERKREDGISIWDTEQKVLGIQEKIRPGVVNICSTECRMPSNSKKATGNHIKCDSRVISFIVKTFFKRAGMKRKYLKLENQNEGYTILLKLRRNNIEEKVDVDNASISRIAEGGTDENNSGLCESEQLCEDIPLHEHIQDYVIKQEVQANNDRSFNDIEVTMGPDTDTKNSNTSSNELLTDMKKSMTTENKFNISTAACKHERARSVNAVNCNKKKSRRGRTCAYNKTQLDHKNLKTSDNLQNLQKLDIEHTHYSIKTDKDVAVPDKSESKHNDNSCNDLDRHEVMNLQDELKDSDVLKNVTNSTYLPAGMKNSVSVYMLNTRSYASGEPNIHGIPWRKFEQYIMREATFARYPSRAVKSKSHLASSGFVYIGEGDSDRVKCYICLVEKENWRPDEDVYETHKRLSPDCPMANSITPFTASLNQADEARTNATSSSELNTSAESQQRSGIKQFGRSTVSSHSVGATANPQCPNTTNEIRTPSMASSQLVQSVASQSFTTDQYSGTPVIEGRRPRDSPSLAYSGNVDRDVVSPTSTVLPVSVSTPNEQEVGARTAGIYSSVMSQNRDQQSRHLDPYRRSTESELQTPTGDSQHYTVPRDPTISVPSTPASAPKDSATPRIVYPQTTSQVQTTLTFKDLGIVTAKPKYPQFASLLKRMETFADFPQEYTVTPEDIATAGMVYTGDEDCCRCFFCGGGLRHWEDGDDPYVEHARWFSKCAYIRQYMGQDFVDAVQDLKPRGGTITMKNVEDHMRRQGKTLKHELEALSIRNDAAVRSLVAGGHNEERVFHVAAELSKSGVPISVDAILKRLYRQTSQSRDASGAAKKDETMTNTNNDQLDNLKEQNYNMRKNMRCKICLDKVVEMVFLPCGHLVACLECAVVLQTCPICRTFIKGVVKAFLQ